MSAAPSPPASGLLVTGTDTGVGKTALAAALLAAARASGRPVGAFKPVVTGLDEPAGSWPYDHELLAACSGQAPGEVAPLRFGPALAPHLAARLAGEVIDGAELLARTRRAQAKLPLDGVLVVEGVGGLLAPLSDAMLVRDYAVELAFGVVIAARPGLGTINHTLLTLEAARSVDLQVRAVVLTPWPQSPGELERSNRETIARVGRVAVATLARVEEPSVEALGAAGESLPWREWLYGPLRAGAPDAAQRDPGHGR